MAFSKTIQMYIFEGNPNGRIMCELSNWNGRIYKISRNELGAFSERSDAENTGVYFLLGKNENNVDTLYVGEAEKMLTRLKQHLKDTLYWSDCIVVVSKDNILNKAHAKFLENKFFGLAKAAGRSEVINNTVPTCSSISEYDEAMLLEFISNTKLLVNTLGYKIFDTIEDSSIKKKDDQILFYIQSARGANAKGVLVADGFAVLKGSAIATSTVPSMTDSLTRFRSELIEKGIIDSTFHFVNDYIFTSPSLAAAVVMGRNANGRIEWKTSEHKTIKDIEEENLN
ncbi:GIY-YIG nuclease family protein [Anaerotignum lactatifermentans]|uniref:GIY-YIG nuclease family protein n=1 Tax=Anaerotignum lactatifermentans TaxID=160404 RepID=A0ABS2G7G9_9FIRM|nr:GIY-YIG nuclease family protein [Anaerotignum lactatifermentans]MBM6828010.1 GIY-YIG nuclease family protein [Anaerotignum lactatifermentans]MBM6876827.1 GIY-YIG nuclease family protein [Anaerotignum lactatifermentans]MBM6949593.1 GIY-YIG nuclease family protein [Anaerotignum lactatifermentans]